MPRTIEYTNSGEKGTAGQPYLPSSFLIVIILFLFARVLDVTIGSILLRLDLTRLFIERLLTIILVQVGLAEDQVSSGHDVCCVKRVRYLTSCGTEPVVSEV